MLKVASNLSTMAQFVAELQRQVVHPVRICAWVRQLLPRKDLGAPRRVHLRTMIVQLQPLRVRQYVIV